MKTLLKIYVGFGIFLLFGTAGASDMNCIAVSQMLKQLLISILIISSGLLLLKEMKLRTNKLLKKRYTRDRISV